MSAGPTIDYAALAKQAGAVKSEPAQVDYAALAKQAGALSSVTPARAESDLNLVGEAGFPQGEPGNRIGPKEIAAAGIIAAPVVVGGLGAAGAAALAARPWWLGGTAAAGQVLQSVKEKAGSMNVNISDKMIKILSDAVQVGPETGGYMPQIVRRFIQRIGDVTREPLTFAEARDFYSNAAALSRDEASKLAKGGPSAFRFAQFKNELGTALKEVAEDAKLPEYARAMKDYARGAAAREQIEELLPILKKYTIAGAGLEGARRIVKGAVENVGP